MIEPLPGETWRPAPGYEGLYEVSDFGRVYAHARERQCGHPGSTPQRRPGYLLKPNPVGNPRTHLAVALTKDGKRRHLKVHRLVLSAFVGPCPLGLESLHWDDDPTNNRLTNLRYGTRSQNLKDRVRNGRHHNTRKTHCPANHEYTPENTYEPRPGKRACRECNRIRLRARRQSQTARKEVAA